MILLILYRQRHIAYPNALSTKTTTGSVADHSLFHQRRLRLITSDAKCSSQTQNKKKRNANQNLALTGVNPTIVLLLFTTIVLLPAALAPPGEQLRRGSQVL